MTLSTALDYRFALTNMFTAYKSTFMHLSCSKSCKRDLVIDEFSSEDLSIFNCCTYDRLTFQGNEAGAYDILKKMALKSQGEIEKFRVLKNKTKKLIQFKITYFSKGKLRTIRRVAKLV